MDSQASNSRVESETDRSTTELSLGVIGKRLLLAFAAMAVLAVPAVIVGMAWNPAGTSVVILGSILALATTATAGYRAGVSAVVALLLLTPLAALPPFVTANPPPRSRWSRACFQLRAPV